MQRPSMKMTWLAGCCLFLVSVLCYGADWGVVTILDGNARVLRGANWYKLVEGARLLDGDVVDAADQAQVQIEMPAGSTVNVAGAAELYAAFAGSHEGKQSAPTEVYLTHGWLKLAAKQGGVALRVRSPAGTIATANGVAVMHATPEALETFVERGTVRMVEPGKGAGEGTVHDLKGGDFAIRASDRPFATADAAPQPFVAAMPRYFRDPLPSRAQLYQVSRVQLVADRSISYAEAEPWLNGPYRRVFIKRLQARLADPEFRTPVMAKLQAYPEWQGVLVSQVTAPKSETPANPSDKPPDKPPDQAELKWPWPFGSTKK
jgi:hypothetical protein